MFDITVGCMLHVASIAIAGILFSPTVTDLSSILRHEKVSALLILGSFCIVIFIGKDAIYIVPYLMVCYCVENSIGFISL